MPSITIVGVIAPKPVAKSTMVSPGWAGDAPVIVDGGPIKLPLACSAAMYRLPLAALVPIVKKAGARGFTFTVTAALVRPFLVVWVWAGPGDTVEGTRKFTCVLLTKLTGTAVPLMVTLTPLTSVGSVLPVSSHV